MAQDIYGRKTKFTTINNFKEFDDYGTFETDDGITLKVATNWFHIFREYYNRKEQRVQFVFYNDNNDFLYFGVVYDDPVTEIYSPDEKGNIKVFILPCPTLFMLYKTNPDFDRLYKLLKESEENQHKFLIGVLWNGYFEIFDIKEIK